MASAERLLRCWHARLLPGEGHLLIIDRMTDLIEALGERRAAP